jgi:hypothetical protein
MALTAALSLGPLMHDTVVLAGAGLALLVGFVLLDVGLLLLLLPGVLARIDRRQGRPTGSHRELGPEATPTISEPAHRRHPAPTPAVERPLGART